MCDSIYLVFTFLHNFFWAKYPFHVFRILNFCVNIMFLYIVFANYITHLNIELFEGFFEKVEFVTKHVVAP